MNFSHKSLAYYFEGKEHEDSEDYGKAIECYYKAFEESKGQKDSGGYSAEALNSISYICSKLGWLEEELKVVDLYINEMMEQNEVLVNDFIEKYPEHEDLALEALETNTPIHASGIALEQYQVSAYITRKEELIELIKSRKIAMQEPERNADFTPKYRKFELDFKFFKVTLECPRCKCVEFHVMNDPFFVCRDCGSYYNDFQQLLDEGAREQLDKAYEEASNYLSNKLTEMFG